ncbi:MAG: GNAT family N-acetyltransferase [DPANN group archaeon]|nr:GNAT family N-acetyltransferase [DPANN group archaeon]
MVMHPEHGCVGYFSLLTDSINLKPNKELKQKWESKGIRFNALPALKIGRLATHKDHEGKGIGRTMIANILLAVLTSIIPKAGCRYITVDALPNAVQWYEQLKFKKLEKAKEHQHNVAMYLDLEELFTAFINKIKETVGDQGHASTGHPPFYYP